jgi:hypothetical protein
VTNADTIGRQWCALHGVPVAAFREEHSAAGMRRVWSDAAGRDVVEERIVPGMGHGTPIDPSSDQLGKAGSFMLDVGVSSTATIAKSWGLMRAEKSRSAATIKPERVAKIAIPVPGKPAATKFPDAPPGIQATIETALRAAGLMR